MIPIEVVGYCIVSVITAEVDAIEDTMTKNCNIRVNWINYNNML